MLLGKGAKVNRRKILVSEDTRVSKKEFVGRRRGKERGLKGGLKIKVLVFGNTKLRSCFFQMSESSLPSERHASVTA